MALVSRSLAQRYGHSITWEIECDEKGIKFIGSPVVRKMKNKEVDAYSPYLSPMTAKTVVEDDKLFLVMEYVEFSEIYTT